MKTTVAEIEWRNNNNIIATQHCVSSYRVCNIWRRRRIKHRNYIWRRKTKDQVKPFERQKTCWSWWWWWAWELLEVWLTIDDEDEMKEWRGNKQNYKITIKENNKNKRKNGKIRKRRLIQKEEEKPVFILRKFFFLLFIIIPLKTGLTEIIIIWRNNCNERITEIKKNLFCIFFPFLHPQPHTLFISRFP